MKLDIVLPTYNRATLLPLALASVFRARRPAGIEVGLLVVDNNSTDETRAVVERMGPDAGMPVRYLFEQAQGRSHALNAGIRASDAELIGMIDDDEEVADDWLEVIARCFVERTDLDFIGGPYRGNWHQPPPAWMPPDFPSVVGVLDGGSEVQRFTPDLDSILPGGNAVVRRRLLLQLGGYHTGLGRAGSQLFGAEDVDMYKRLLEAGAVGEYRPDLVIYHHIPAERLTRDYFRRWSTAHGRSLGVLARRHPQQVPHVAGLPRYEVREALESAGRLLLKPHRFRTAPGEAFSDELRVRQFVSFAWAKWRG